MRSPVNSDFKLPELRFVPVENLVPHEQHDEQRMHPLVERLREQGVLKNPPIVAPLPGETGDEARYVVLDGANRSTAVRAAGLPHVLVQVVRYDDPGVELSTWSHALSQYPRDELEAAIRKIPGVECRAAMRMHARALLARREALAFVAFEGAEVLTLHGGKDLPEKNRLLNLIVDLYRQCRRFYRVSNDSIDDARARHPEVTAVVVFPHFEPVEILELAHSGSRLPAGITRHLIRWRALRLNIPLERLADQGQTLAEKNRWLEDWLKDKVARSEVRHYEEPTVLFDE